VESDYALCCQINWGTVAQLLKHLSYFTIIVKHVYLKVQLLFEPTVLSLKIKPSLLYNQSHAGSEMKPPNLMTKDMIMCPLVRGYCRPPEAMEWVCN
jgi:hypothetical protein